MSKSQPGESSSGRGRGRDSLSQAWPACQAAWRPSRTVRLVGGFRWLLAALWLLPLGGGLFLFAGRSFS